MISYTLFDFATAPRTGSTWFIKAAEEAGLGTGSKFSVHTPMEGKSRQKLAVSLVRHPCEWLRSYYDAIFPGKIGVDAVDQLADLTATTFEQFVDRYLKHVPGQVGKIFQAYPADVFMKIEDQPWALIELLISYGVPPRQYHSLRSLTPQNGTKHPSQWPPGLFEEVAQAEDYAINHWEYW